MSDPIEVPQPVTWAVNVAAVETQRAAKTEADIADLDKRIAAAKLHLDELEDEREEAIGWHKKHVKNAVVARRMAERECADHGWEMPPIPAEAPLVETTQFPAVPPRSVSLREACVVCGDPIALPPGGTWLHINGKPACDLVHGEGTATAPVQTVPDRSAKPGAHVCCVCGNAPGTYENYQGQWFCWPCADGETVPAPPAVQMSRACQDGQCGMCGEHGAAALGDEWACQCPQHPAQSVPDRSAERRPLNPENLVAADCGNCGQQISRNMPGDRWRHQDGCVECPIPGGTSAEPYILPAPPAAATVTDPPADETPKDGADHG